jgi:hypothetical protein
LTALPVHSAAVPSAFVDRLQLSLLWLLGASGGIVLVEPAPYEFVMALAMLVFFATGMTLRSAHIPIVLLLALYNIGFVIGVVPVLGLDGTAKWTAISCFMAVTTVFFALALSDDTERRLVVLLHGYVLGAVVVSLIGVLAYFRLLPSSDTFLLYGRAKSTFKDPNVFGPFLVLPGLLLMQRMMFGRLRDFLVGGAMLMVIVGGLFLSFSRGAWGHFGVSVAILLALSYLTSRSATERLRIVIVAMVATGALVLLLAALLSLPEVAAVFQERASLVQSYDAGHTGRFGRHILGALLMLDHPIGIGPLQFTKYFPEDPHNSFLDSFVAGGWLSGLTFATMVLVTLVSGLRHVFIDTPFRAPYLALYATFAAEVGESYVIDVQHWRHYFLIMGALWGLMVATSTRVGRARSAPALNP